MTTYYWIAGSGTMRQGMSGSHLSLSSGGSPISGSITWTAADSLVVDANSGPSGLKISVTSPALALGGIDCSAAPSMQLADAGSFYLAQGNAIFNSGVSVSVPISFAGTNQSLATGGARFGKPILVALSGTFSLLDDFLGSGFGHKSGVIETNSHKITCGSFVPYSTPSPLREVRLGTSVVTLSGVQLDIWNVQGSASVDALGSVIKLIGAATANGIDFRGGGFSYGAVEFQNGSGSVRIAGANSFTSLALGGQATYKLVDAQSADALGADAGSNRLGIQSATGGTQRILTAQTVSVLNNVDFKDIDAEGPAIPWSGTGLGDLGSNSNIAF